MKLKINKEALWGIALSVANFIKRLYLILAIACLAIVILSMSMTYPEAGLPFMPPLVFFGVVKVIEIRKARKSRAKTNKKQSKRKTA